MLRQRLAEVLHGYEMVKEIRGEGLLLGIEFTAPRSLRLRVPFEAFLRIHPAMFGQIVVMRMFRDHGILTQICGNNFLVLKAAPPLVVTGEQIEEFVAAIGGCGRNGALPPARSGPKRWGWRGERSTSKPSSQLSALSFQ